jgi:hypothetical protein
MLNYLTNYQVSESPFLVTGKQSSACYFCPHLKCRFHLLFISSLETTASQPYLVLQLIRFLGRFLFDFVCRCDLDGRRYIVAWGSFTPHYPTPSLNIHLSGAGSLSYSVVHISMEEYPGLDKEARNKVWQNSSLSYI